MDNYGLGGVFKTGARWWVRYSHAGKQIRETTKILIGPDEEASRAKAQKFLQRRLVEIQSGDFTPHQNRLTIEDVLDTFIAKQKMEGRKALDSTEAVLRHVRGFFKGYRAHAVTAPKLRDYVVHRQEQGAAPASIDRELAHLRTAMRLAVDDKRLASMPKFPALKYDNHRTGFIEPSAFQALRAELPEDLRDVATFLFWSGWRSNEAKTLEWRDVNIGQGEIRLRSENSKTRESRTLPLFGEIKEVIERLHASRRLDCLYVFTRADGRPLVKAQLPATWKAAAQRAGLGPLTPHDCRRSAVRNLVRAGISQHVAMAWTGHKTASVFHRYDITSGSDLERAAEKLTAYVEAESAKQSKVVPLARSSRKLAHSTGTEG